jgi:N-acetyl-gamma-glutamyl-phosphate reductase
MLVSVPLQLWQLKNKITPAEIYEALVDYYSGQHLVKVNPINKSMQLDRIDPEELNGTNKLKIYVFANEIDNQALICAQLDNLGKGASGQAVQNLNIMLGLDPTTGLI